MRILKNIIIIIFRNKTNRETVAFVSHQRQPFERLESWKCSLKMTRMRKGLVFLFSLATLSSLYIVFVLRTETQHRILEWTTASNNTASKNTSFRLGRPKVDLFIAVISAPSRLDRRTAIREGYASTINKFPIAFRFFTDALELEPQVRKEFQQKVVTG